jgi:hypothetical protein
MILKNVTSSGLSKEADLKVKSGQKNNTRARDAKKLYFRSKSVRRHLFFCYLFSHFYSAVC